MLLDSSRNRAPSMGLPKPNGLPLIHILIMSSAFLSALLRLNQDSDITLFRIMMPLVLFFIAFYDRVRMTYLVIIVFCITLSQAISFYLTPYNFDFYNIAFYLNYVTMMIIGFYAYVLDDRFEKASIDRFLSIYFYILLLVLVAQSIVKFNLPNIPDAVDAANAWYGNENDASLTLAAFIFYAARFGLLRKHAVGAIVAFIMMNENGSRACMLSVAILMYYLVIRRFGLATAVYLALLATVLFVGYLGYFVQGVNVVAEISEFLDNLFASIENMFKLQIVGIVVSSLDVRSIGAALTFIDFANHPLFGIGAGNTISLIEQNGSIFNYTVGSTHNMPLTMLAELGIFGIAAFLYPIFRTSKLKLWSFAFWLSLYLFSSLSQSGGFMTNFFVLVTFVIVMARPDNVAKEGRRQSAGRARVAHSV